MGRTGWQSGLFGGLLLVSVLAACGSDDTEDGVSSERAPPSWVEQELDVFAAADHPAVIGSDGSQIVLLSVDEQGRLLGHATDAAGRFVAGEPLELGAQHFGITAIVRHGAEWLALGGGSGGEQSLFQVSVFRSVDGRNWAPVEASGFDTPADVLGLVATEDGVVAVGALRTAADPSSGGFVPVAWRSADGVTWSTVPLPSEPGSDGVATSVAFTGDEVLAAGRDGDAGVLWASGDGGASWDMTEREGIPPTSQLSAVAAQGDLVVLRGFAQNEAGIDYPAELTLLSDDSGRSWRESSEPMAPSRNAGFVAPVVGGGVRFLSLVYSYLNGFDDPSSCYAEISLCEGGMQVSLHASDDGDRWYRVDTSGLGDSGRLVGLAAANDGRVVALTELPGGHTVWTWPAGAPLPRQTEPVMPTAEVDLLAPDEQPEVGRRYGVPLNIHCGMDWLYVGGQPWHRTDDGIGVETGSGDQVPAHWPVAQQTIFGYATLGADGTIVYSIGDGEVIATYEPATEDPPGCM